MSHASRLGAHLYADEASFGDSSTTTFDEQLAIKNEVDASGLTQDKIPLMATRQYQSDAVHGARGPYGGTFTIQGYLTGHGSTCAGAVTATTEETYLSRVIGNIDATQSGTTVAAGTSASQFSLTAGSVSAGGLIRVGSIGDNRGNGQFYAVNNASTITVLNELEATPNASDEVYAPVLVYPSEGPTADSVTSTRHQLLTANQCYNAWGVGPQAISLSGFNPGELPEYSVTHQVAYWQPEASPTFPTGTNPNAFTPAPVSAGSFFFQTVGTVTQQLYDIRDFQLTIDMTVTPLMTPQTDNARQIVGGYRRTMCKASFSFTIDAEAAGTDTFGDLHNASGATPNYQHCMYSLSCEDGSAVGIYFPKVHIRGARPVQFNDNGLNRMRVECEAVTGDDTATELERANFVLAFA